MMNISNEVKLLPLKKISEIYSIPLTTLRRWASERRFPLYKISNRISVDVDEFNGWICKHKINLDKKGVKQ